MTDLKREYVVPLRRKTRLAPRWRRSKKAVSVLKEFMQKHMKTDDVIVCKELNEYIWANGAKNPPGKVSVVALKTHIGGEDRTIVNLLDKGIEKQQEIYKKNLEQVQSIAKEISSDKKHADSKEEVKDVEVKEKPSKEVKKSETETKVESKEEKVVEEKKEEAKK